MFNMPNKHTKLPGLERKIPKPEQRNSHWSLYPEHLNQKQFKKAHLPN